MYAKIYHGRETTGELHDLRQTDIFDESPYTVDNLINSGISSIRATFRWRSLYALFISEMYVSDLSLSVHPVSPVPFHLSLSVNLSPFHKRRELSRIVTVSRRDLYPHFLSVLCTVVQHKFTLTHQIGHTPARSRSNPV